MDGELAIWTGERNFENVGRVCNLEFRKNSTVSATQPVASVLHSPFALGFIFTHKETSRWHNNQLNSSSPILNSKLGKFTGKMRRSEPKARPTLNALRMAFHAEGTSFWQLLALPPLGLRLSLALRSLSLSLSLALCSCLPAAVAVAAPAKSSPAASMSVYYKSTRVARSSPLTSHTHTHTHTHTYTHSLTHGSV